ncbi:MAG: NifB/NifX family molybdenum-iron cluster-binding protein [Dysgonamonadaceae bacterium]|jgi:predicted Fe-Mo cluster-binding NifX family protein|nr:NifB/NifX family molybdenum-iron cluster-binding protein [Dysgonamonadaceae bacterium]MDD3309058.1 NifB/NifX family molybdenum-iron cluster-binding protein [Dysgonamonadaceae bacterium]MDD3901701.1 NifB/NifX family molybdenum-iron cluster-binding protein [Dysgonamonadaceae bacterium]MDD4399974.1 NifB/NifX family molybdenum-iron cluster-binding protein [Dysgonamonadaceae bacterium]
MKLAIPVNKNNEVDGHFGNCDMYTVVTLNDKNEIIDTDTIASSKGCGCKSDIAKMLAAQGVTNMLVGGIGTGAVNKLNEAGIEVVRGCSGNVEELAVNFATGKITDNGSNCEHHHNHHHEHHHESCNHL